MSATISMPLPLPLPLPVHGVPARIVIRPWRDGDQADLVAAANDRRVWRNLDERFPHPYTRVDADWWVANASSAGDVLDLAVEVDGRAQGGVGARPGPGVRCRTGVLGYWLGAACWGRGIASATVGVFVDALLATGRYTRLEATVYAWNPASMRVLEKCGFDREGVLRCAIWKDGTLVDAVMYARLAAGAAQRERAAQSPPATSGMPSTEPR
jgi:RimJ/RimL family protein N-acetyltransferase